MATLRVLYSDSTDPWFNLAVEESIFRSLPATHRVLYLWRNDRVVVIGRAQNPWKECNTAKMAQDGVKLARRSSGGGAVYHDLGNSCFTFMASKPEYNKDISTQIVLNGLRSLGITAKASGRNDLVIKTADGERKISGAAYKETHERGFHHGTLLIHTDMTRLATYLNPDPKKLQAKGITSVSSRVANVNDYFNTVTHQTFCDAVTQAFFDYYQSSTLIEHISANNLPDLPDFAKQFAHQSSWEWNFGHAPDFSHYLSERFVWGGVDIYFDIAQGRIVKIKTYTDSLNPAPFEMLENLLQNSRYEPAALLLQLDKLQSHFPNSPELVPFSKWFIAQIC